MNEYIYEETSVDMHGRAQLQRHGSFFKGGHRLSGPLGVMIVLSWNCSGLANLAIVVALGRTCESFCSRLCLPLLGLKLLGS